MQNVVTIITNPTQQILDEAIMNKVFITLEKNSATISNIKWLALDEACDVFFDGWVTSEKVTNALGKALEGTSIDYVVQKNNNRQKQILISDMDSTIINQECIDEIAAKLGVKDKVSEITERAMNGELDFADSLRERVLLLKELHEDELLDVYNNNITIMSGAETLLRTMGKSNAYCVLVSGGFTFFTSRIAERLGFNEHRANRLVITGNHLNGKVVEPILDKNSKLEALEEIINKQKVAASDVLAVGDGANDLPMLKAAGLGIAYHAKPKVRQEAGKCINHTDLKSLLYVQGYLKEEFVE